MGYSLILKKNLVPDLHADFAKKVQTAQLDDLFTRDGLRGMIDGEITMLLIRCFPLLRCLFTEALVLWRDAP